MSGPDPSVAAAWDAGYAAGRYPSEPPSAFAADILAAAHRHIRAAQQRLTPGGLFCLRVNATATDVWPRHQVTEHHHEGSFTVRYLTGPKHGLSIHFFADAELDALFTGEFTPVLPLRLQQTRRDPPQPGQWSQWEAAWQKARSKRGGRRPGYHGPASLENSRRAEE
ncbi:MAG: hypothetical protein ACRDOL_24250 [Streptosporangiaceae bacterium]